MLPSKYICSVPLAIMAAEQQATCHWRFQGLPEFTVNLADKFQLDSNFKATTLPGLGLIETTYETNSSGALNDGREPERKPWEKFKSYVEHLNSQSPDTTKYKVLYVTRHGLGHHNVFEAQVGREAWNVSSDTFPQH